MPGADAFAEVGFGGHAIEERLGFGHRRADVAVQIGVELTLALAHRRRADLRSDRAGVFELLLLYLAPSIVDAGAVVDPAKAMQGQALYERIRSRVSERIFLAPVPAE